MELFGNDAQAVVLSGAGGAVAPGTVETWTVDDAVMLPPAATGVSWWRGVDPALPSEKFLVTGVTGNTLTVTRGTEGTTPVDHGTSFLLRHVLTAAAVARYDWTPADHGLLAWAFDPAGLAAGAALTAAGLLHTVRLHLPAACSVTSIVMGLEAAGSGLTAGQCFAGLWDAATGTLIGVSADQSAAWAGSPGELDMALTGGPLTAGPGDVYAGAWFNGTTGPTFSAGGSSALMNAGSAVRFGQADTGLTASPPDPIGAISALAAPVRALWAALK